MLDLYYRTEKALPLAVEDIARLIRMREFGAAIRDVLNEFFQRTDDGWMHARCDAEIAKMQDKQAKAKASAQASVNARSTNAQRTLNERSTKVELPTPTPTPLPKKRKEKDAPASLTVETLVAEGLTQDLAEAWLAHRKAKKAPLTRVAWTGFAAEAFKAGWPLNEAVQKAIARNWTSFEASWVQEPAKAATSFYESDQAKKKAIADAWMGSALPKKLGDVIEMESPNERLLAVNKRA
jgi:uncharacterized protein YdaU (DUF1376 family)